MARLRGDAIPAGDRDRFEGNGVDRDRGVGKEQEQYPLLPGGVCSVFLHQLHPVQPARDDLDLPGF